MQVFSLMTKRLSLYMAVLAGVILLIMMGLTFGDIIGRFFGHPVKGTNDIMCMLGALLAGFALPRASLQGAHVYVDLVTDKLPGKVQKVVKIITKFLGALLFLVGTLYLILFGRNLFVTNTVSVTLRLPLYPVAFGLAAGCLMQCLVLLYHIFGDKGEEK